MSYRLTIGKEQQTTTVEDEENILDAVTHAKIKAPLSCRNGNCMICEAVLISGSVSQSYQDINGREKFLPCKSVALSDCHFSFLHRQYTDESHRLACQVLEIKHNGPSWQLHLLLPAGKLQPINIHSIELTDGRKKYTSQSAKIDHRNLIINTSYDPAPYLDGSLVYIHYQTL
jgi:ferredoxin